MDTSFATARHNMIEQQIRPWDMVGNRVLDVMEGIPREHFVPDGYRRLAYADIEVPIGTGGQSMLAPKIVARMLQALDVQEGDRVLEIGTGTGYATACLVGLGGRVTSLEIDPGLVAQSQEILKFLGVQNADVQLADALAGTLQDTTFEVIAVTGSLPEDGPLAALQEMLAPGGRLFAFIGEAPAMEAVLVTREADGPYRETQFEYSVPALANVPEPEHFVF